MAYQHILGSFYLTRILSFLDQTRRGLDLKAALFLPADSESARQGLRILKDAGYGETGQTALSQEILSQGKVFFLLGLLILCAAGCLFEIVFSVKIRQKLLSLIKKNELSLSEEFRLEREYLETERNKMGTYMENLSHQLRTPAAGALLSLEYLQDIETDPEKKRRLNDCIDQISNMSEITSTLLRLAQIDSGKIWIKRQKNNLTDLTKSCLQRIQILAEEKNLVLQTDLADNCMLSCDGFWIKEALENVLKNAVTYTPCNGIIRVTLKPSGDSYDLQIFNSGRLLPPNERESIFHRFYQTDPDSSAGFGIGLHLAREIARLHQGNLRVLDSDESGTIFQFLLPCFIAK